MRCKVARRKHKLTALHGQNDRVTSFADRVMTEAAQELILRQSNFIKHNTPVNILPRPRSLDFTSDSVHSPRKWHRSIKILFLTFRLPPQESTPNSYLQKLRLGYLTTLTPGYTTI
ncbi:uncharacterized protein PpBr36_06786 [Pyricularia pennisetigena]|uniref:uncharacterized protein n=1 Tax=Pyricularia pennisetigena TaxID=1578925 RepID=UPI00114EC423|nr:uncharacterized protein PpBr36_06786 [Pyricularia pennisetigena]TLS22582.1 hypothetical protein PpBr36_06786 [Pyricularia pennisetigena]